MDINLLDVLSQEDKDKIYLYRKNYAKTCYDMASTDEYLAEWAKSNKRLYKLLGNQLIYKTPYSYEISDYEKGQEIVKIINKYSYNVIDVIYEFLMGKIILSDKQKKQWKEYKVCHSFSSERLWKELLIRDAINSKNCYINNRIAQKITIPRKNHQVKTVTLQEGTKIFRALNKIVDEIPDDYGIDIQTVKDNIEKFRIEISMVTNTNIRKSNLCFSIHPLDFMTMSDNSNGWSSCMSWTDEGCYRTGTVEMMNSNNVICCYLEKEGKFFDFINITNNNTESNATWNNKIWRSLLYVEKDIICSGKSYPSTNQDLSKYIVNIAKDLARMNFGWKYEYGMQQYNDMKLTTPHSLENTFHKIVCGDAKKHNILFETNKMYNDMLNDKDYTFWCVRNKVPHSKIISLSGKVLCNCCGKEMHNRGERFGNGSYYEDYMSYYNDRYGNTEALECQECRDFRCYYCGERQIPREDFTIVKGYHNEERRVCPSCLKNLVYCKHCGRVYENARVPYIYSRYITWVSFDKNLNNYDKATSYFNSNLELVQDLSLLKTCETHDNAKKIIKDIEDRWNLYAVSISSFCPCGCICTTQELNSMINEVYIKIRSDEYGFLGNATLVYDTNMTKEELEPYHYDNIFYNKE